VNGRAQYPAGSTALRHRGSGSSLRSARAKQPVPILQCLSARAVRPALGDVYPLTMHALKAVSQHRAVFFRKNVRANLDNSVRPNSDEVSVERRVVDLAEREPVVNLRHSKRVPVGDDVARIQKLTVAETAERTLVPIGCEHSFAESL